jgi:hypothetical protein
VQRGFISTGAGVGVSDKDLGPLADDAVLVGGFGEAFADPRLGSGLSHPVNGAEGGGLIGDLDGAKNSRFAGASERVSCDYLMRGVGPGELRGGAGDASPYLGMHRAG